MNSLLLHCLVFMSWLPSGCLQTSFDSIPMYNSPIVHPELQPQLLILSPVFDTTASERVPSSRMVVDTVAQNIIAVQNRQKENALIYYQQEHLRLDGMLRAKNTDKRIHINSYASEANRNGDKDIGLQWTISGYPLSNAPRDQADHLWEVLINVVEVLGWYADVHERTIDWSTVTFRLQTTYTLAAVLPATYPIAYSVELTPAELPAGKDYLLLLEAPSFFKNAYDEYLNKAAKIDRDTRMQLKRHR